MEDGDPFGFAVVPGVKTANTSENSGSSISFPPPATSTTAFSNWPSSYSDDPMAPNTNYSDAPMSTSSTSAPANQGVVGSAVTVDLFGAFSDDGGALTGTPHAVKNSANDNDTGAGNLLEFSPDAAPKTPVVQESIDLFEVFASPPPVMSQEVPPPQPLPISTYNGGLLDGPTTLWTGHVPTTPSGPPSTAANGLLNENDIFLQMASTMTNNTMSHKHHDPFAVVISSAQVQGDPFAPIMATTAQSSSMTRSSTSHAGEGLVDGLGISNDLATQGSSNHLSTPDATSSSSLAPMASAAEGVPMVDETTTKNTISESLVDKTNGTAPETSSMVEESALDELTLEEKDEATPPVITTTIETDSTISSIPQQQQQQGVYPSVETTGDEGKTVILDPNSGIPSTQVLPKNQSAMESEMDSQPVPTVNTEDAVTPTVEDQQQSEITSKEEIPVTSISVPEQETTSCKEEIPTQDRASKDDNIQPDTTDKPSTTLSEPVLGDQPMAEANVNNSALDESIVESAQESVATPLPTDTENPEPTPADDSSPNNTESMDGSSTVERTVEEVIVEKKELMNHDEAQKAGVETENSPETKKDATETLPAKPEDGTVTSHESTETPIQSEGKQVAQISNSESIEAVNAGIQPTTSSSETISEVPANADANTPTNPTTTSTSTPSPSETEVSEKDSAGSSGPSPEASIGGQTEEGASKDTAVEQSKQEASTNPLNDALVAANKELLEKIEQLEKDLQKSQSEVGQLQEAKSKHEKEASNQASLFKELQSTLRAQMSKRADAENDFQHATAEIKAIKEDYDKLSSESQEKIKLLEEKLAEATTAQSTMELELESTRQQSEASTKKEASMALRLNEIITVQGENGNAVKYYEDQVEKLTNDLEMSRNNLATVTRDRDRLTEEVAQWKSFAEARSKQLEKSLDREKTLNQDRKRKMKEFVEAKTEEVRVAKSDTLGLQTEIDQTNMTLKDLNQRYKQLHTQWVEAQTLNRELQRDITKMKKDSEKMSKVGGTLEAKLSRSAQESEDHKNKRLAAKHEVMAVLRKLEVERDFNNRVRERIKDVFTPKALTQQQSIRELVDILEGVLQKVAVKLGRPIPPPTRNEGSMDTMADEGNENLLPHNGDSPGGDAAAGAALSEANIQRAMNKLENETKRVTQYVQAATSTTKRLQALVDAPSTRGCVGAFSSFLLSPHAD